MHTQSYKHTSANSNPMNIFKDWTGKSSRLTKSPQASRCRPKRRLLLKARHRYILKYSVLRGVEPKAIVTTRLQVLSHVFCAPKYQDGE